MTEPLTRSRSSARVFVTALVVTALLAGVGRAPVARATANPWRGTWVLHEVSSLRQLNGAADKIRHALKVDGVIGLSVRVPWRSLEPRKGVYDFRIFNRAREIAGREKLAIRFMAGRFTPSFRLGHSMRYDGSATGGRGRGSVIPLPFGRGGGPNDAFERGWKRLVDHMARWGRAHRTTRILHLSWPGLLWAELALIDQMKRQPGYSYAAASNTHQRLLSYGMRKATKRMYVEFASTGHAPGQLNADITRRLLASPRRGKIFLQTNNLAGGYSLPRSAPPPKRGAQMVGQGGSYDWGRVYDQLRGMYGTYLEVYTPSFSAGNAGQLAREAGQFR
jgi:hypothetical protein